jgi:NAD(P)-dependent dehydrogenase (short-subunit alcohol dehydrogenase family)
MVERPGRVEGKVCVVTGGAGAIGAATAEALAAEGAIVVVADLDRAAAEAVAATVPNAEGAAVDVTDDASVAALYAGVAERHGRVDVCVNNAAILHPQDVDPVTTPLDVWHRVLAVDLTGVFLCLKHGLPHVIAAGGGSIVNMASMTALVGSATPQIAYGAAKGGVVAMTRECAVMYAQEGVRVNCVAPGPIETPLYRVIFGNDPAAQARRRRHIPFGRVGRVDEVAQAVLHLAGDESSYVTGTTYVVDGGITVAYTTQGDEQ